MNEYNHPFTLIPDGNLNHLRGFFNVVLYGMTTWGDLFDPRQTVSLLTLQKLISQLHSDRLAPDIREAVMTCLAMILDRCADKCASVVVWNNVGEKVEHVFGRQALPMVWDYAEANILADIGWSGACGWVLKVIEHTLESKLQIGSAVQASATNHPLPSDSADAVITDPPYYAAIPYADLSDFFYSWLRRSLYDVHPDLFRTELTPKDDECVSLSHRAAMYRNKNNTWFEKMMTLACQEGCRITKASGVSIFVFANKETSGWEAMLAALISAGWIVTASWPIDTEMATRLRARNSAALASSVHLVCRPREDENGNLLKRVGDWRDVLQELPRRIYEWLPRLANEGVVGADAIFACLGPALEIFSRYSRVEKANGDLVSLSEYLIAVWAAVSKEALTMVFAGADTSGFEEDARLTAMWLWTLSTGTVEQEAGENSSIDDESESEEETEKQREKGNKGGYALEYDAARKIAQGLGAHLEQLSTLIQVKGSEARLLSVRDRTKYLFGKVAMNEPEPRSRKAKQPTLFDASPDVKATDWEFQSEDDFQPGITTLDRVHQSMLLFQSGRIDVLKRFLVDQGIGQNERFWRLAQAFSALYPPGSDEKRWVDGVLARKKGLGL